MFYFASEIKALLASGAVPAAVDVQGLDHLFTFYALGTRRTLFDGVQSILPGHYLRIAFRQDGAAAEIEERRYWDFDFPDWGHEQDAADPTALIDEFEATFQRAVEIRLSADVPVVGYLSGGVDLAYVLATASKIAGRPLPSFTIQVPVAELDEAAHARESSNHIGGAATVIEAEASVIADNYAGLIRAAECPVLDTSCAALLALSRNVHAQGYKAVLTGEGADEAFAGYVWFKIREAARNLDIGGFHPSTAISRLARKVAAPNLSFGEFARIDAMIGGPHAQSIMYNLVATSRDRYYSAELKERLGSFVAYEDLVLDLERMRRWHPLNQSLYLGYKIHLAGLLINAEGRSRRHGEQRRGALPVPRRGRDRVCLAASSALEAAWASRRQISAAPGGGAAAAGGGGAAQEGHVPRAARRDLPRQAAVLRARSDQPRLCLPAPAISMRALSPATARR